MVHCFKCSREVLKDKDRGERGCSSSVEGGGGLGGSRRLENMEKSFLGLENED